MRVIRSSLAAGCFAVFGLGSFVFGLSLLPVLFLFPEFPRRRIALGANRFLWKLFVALMESVRLISVRVENLERLTTARGAVIAANHPSLIDVVLLLVRTPRSVCVVKGRLLRNIFMSRVVRIAHLGNDLPPNEFFSKAETLLSRGFNILIFPEGTRTVPGVPSDFHRGAARLSLLVGVPVIPVKISVCPPILGKHQKWWQVGDRRVAYRLRALPELEPRAFRGNDESEHVRAKKMTEALREALSQEI